MKALAGVDVFIVDALRQAPHPSHAHLDLALAWSADIGAKQTVLTNLHIDMDYNTLRKGLPDSVSPGFDGMEIVRSV